MCKVKASINVKGVSKKFRIGAKPPLSLRETIYEKIQLKSRQNKRQDFWALKDITFTINQGEVVGIIGSNGAGKSTLLKILSRITPPTKGSIELYGRFSSLLEVGTGFHPELTGRENVYLNGAILGMSKKEIRSKFEAIVEFSGVKDFIEVPVKHYSSGMKVRLAFSVAAHLNPDILIVDEVLAVGDSDFQKKCLGTMKQVANSGRTVLFVSHNMGAIAQLCKRVMVLDHGGVIYDGEVEQAISYYTNLKNNLKTYENPQIDSQRSIQITKVFLLNKQNEIKNSFVHDESIKLCIKFNATEVIKGLNICISVYNYLQYPIFTSDVALSNFQLGKNHTIVKIPPGVLKAGHYSFLVAIHSPNRGVKALEFIQYICPMTIYDNGSEFSKYEGIWETGDVFVDCQWEFNS